MSFQMKINVLVRIIKKRKSGQFLTCKRKSTITSFRIIIIKYIRVLNTIHTSST